MKIIFCIKSMYQTKGGAERVLALVANGLAARGHDVSLLTFDAPNVTPSYPLDGAVKRLFMDIGEAHRPTTWGEAWQRLVQTRRTLVAQQPDVVISFMYSSYVLTALALLGTGIKLIGSEHILPAYYKNRPLHFPLLLASTLLMDKVTVVTDHIITLFPRWVRRKLVCVPNPVVLPDAPALPVPDGQKIALNIGRMTDQKNQELLINAFASIAADCPAWHLRIVGDGELRPALAAQIAKLGLSDRITLAPPSDAIAGEYKAASLFAISSRYESFGLVTAEAMQCGVPAVGFADCPGTNEIIIDGQNGLLAAGLTNTASFAAAMNRLMRDDALRAACSAKAPASVQKYQLAPVLDTWEKVIHNVVS